jgi:hypothetical protein
MRKQPKVIEPKNARAVSLLKSWLRQLGISYEIGVSAGVDLVVGAKDGQRIQVQVSCGESVSCPVGAVVIQGGVLTGRDIQAGLDLFSTFVSSLGYEPQPPVNRGELPEKKLNYVENFEDVTMRHTELRRCPNPSAGQMEQYADVMKKATYSFLRSFHRFCRENSLEFDDLYTYAQVWTVIYLGYYEVPMHAITENNNQKKLYKYLSQRFLEFFSVTEKKAKNIFGASHARDGTFWDRPGGDGKDRTVFNEINCLLGPYRIIDEIVDDQYVARHCRLDVRTPNTRRSSATAVLEEELSMLPHDILVEKLQEAADNVHIHPDAQREAVRRLDEHRASCLDCGPSDLHVAGQVRENEDVAGVHSGGAGK